MGGVVSYLGCLLCRSGCKPSIVAAALTFYPPDPAYYAVEKRTKGMHKLIPHPGLPLLPYEGLEVHFIPTSKQTSICAFYFPVQNARHTLLYSHGNAADLGSMYERYVCSCYCYQAAIVI